MWGGGGEKRLSWSFSAGRCQLGNLLLIHFLFHLLGATRVGLLLGATANGWNAFDIIAMLIRTTKMHLCYSELHFTYELLLDLGCQYISIFIYVYISGKVPTLLTPVWVAEIKAVVPWFLYCHLKVFHTLQILRLWFQGRRRVSVCMYVCGKVFNPFPSSSSLAEKFFPLPSKCMQSFHSRDKNNLGVMPFSRQTEQG